MSVTCPDCGISHDEYRCSNCGGITGYRDLCPHCQTSAIDARCNSYRQQAYRATTGYKSESQYIMRMCAIIVPVVLIGFIGLLWLLGVFD
ncbi:MAG: hypothetical protein P1Q69_17670 [Candidatus Thorarchaeota archaeon]|nr:hypothetical protein [Candidatus Thorarchaeota archaeon]